MNLERDVVRTIALERRFGDLVAVDSLSFHVKAGELFGIVGPDGAGKTTLLRMLAGVLRPTAGDAEVIGTSVARDSEGVKQRIAYMSQRFGLYTDLTVRENIDFYADLYQVPTEHRPARLERLYQFSQLGPFEHRLAGALSGGMKQKLSLCCALIHHPDLLLLDEPTFGVDPISRRDLWLIVHQMVAEGMTAVVSTAYLDEAERCDRVLLLDHGRILALDDPVRLQTGFERKIVSLETRPARRAIEVLETVPEVHSATLFGNRLHVALEPQAVWDPIARRLKESGIAVELAQEMEPSLEDLFIELVSKGGSA